MCKATEPKEDALVIVVQSCEDEPKPEPYASGNLILIIAPSAQREVVREVIQAGLAQRKKERSIREATLSERLDDIELFLFNKFNRHSLPDRKKYKLGEFSEGRMT